MPAPATPADIDHPRLRELAEHAVWVAKVEAAVDALGEILWPPGLDDESDEEDPHADEDDEDPLALASELVEERFEEDDRALEAELIAWLAEDPEHWPIFRLVLLDPWQHEPGRWREGVPRWVRVLSADTVLAHFQQDPYGRRRELRP